ncbi:MAG: anti-sigma regulatory factor [Chloroflexi bacterium]|nr:anti-sigma regulatory factor [Chloroflexota bacterium]MBU1878248.1 anti-sigma regulatory factor [Chloroflexota bacterium]
MPEQRVPIRSDLDIVNARVAGRELARALGFGVIDQARVATAISELARNIVLYAGSGVVVLNQIHDGRRVGLEAVCIDAGPGIVDIDLALRDGYSTSHGLGMGLPGTRRLMDEFEIESAPGQGTRITIRKWQR